jgi:hypothetical protein
MKKMKKKTDCLSTRHIHRPMMTTQQKQQLQQGHSWRKKWRKKKEEKKETQAIAAQSCTSSPEAQWPSCGSDAGDQQELSASLTSSLGGFVSVIFNYPPSHKEIGRALFLAGSFLEIYNIAIVGGIILRLNPTTRAQE